jgi:hypothetical protein
MTDMEDTYRESATDLIFDFMRLFDLNLTSDRKSWDLKEFAVQLPRNRPEAALMLGTQRTNRVLRLHFPMRLGDSPAVAPPIDGSLFDSWRPNTQRTDEHVRLAWLQQLKPDFKDAIYWTIEDKKGVVLARTGIWTEGITKLLPRMSFIFEALMRHRERKLDELASHARQLQVTQAGDPNSLLSPVD